MSLSVARNQVWRGLSALAILLSIMWILGLLNLVTGYRLTSLGILPRTASGLIGIPISPFIHGSMIHLVVNSISFVMLGSLVAIRGRREYLETTVLIILVSGIGVWIVGRSSYHLGASGLIFGYFGYLVGDAWYGRRVGAVATALLVLLLYGGMLWGIVPTWGRVSWESHLCGLLAGILAAHISAEPTNRD